jgi:Flp pilus assembly protein CpaB
MTINGELTTMARSRSTTLIAFGVAMFVFAGALAVLATRGNGGNKDNAAKASADAPTVTVRQAAETTPTTPAVTPVKIPTGKEALQLQLPAVAGLAGYAKTGDRVNVYGTFKDRVPNASVKPGPLAKLVLSNVEVLSAVNGGTNVTYVLAVNPNEAEQLIYLSSFEGIWMTLVRDGAPAVGGTPGHNAANAA